MYTHTHALCRAARKEMGMTDPKKKRLSADVLRTLESIYTRTAFPSNDVIKCVTGATRSGQLWHSGLCLCGQRVGI